MNDELFSDDDPAYMFDSLSDLINFVTWLTDNFDSPEDFEALIAEVTQQDFDEAYEDGAGLEDVLDRILLRGSCTRHAQSENEYLECPECGAIFVTPSGLGIHMSVLHTDSNASDKDTEFWSIIENFYTNHQEEPNGDLQHPE